MKVKIRKVVEGDSFENLSGMGKRFEWQEGFKGVLTRRGEGVRGWGKF